MVHIFTFLSHLFRSDRQPLSQWGKQMKWNGTEGWPEWAGVITIGSCQIHSQSMACYYLHRWRGCRVYTYIATRYVPTIRLRAHPSPVCIEYKRLFSQFFAIFRMQQKTENRETRTENRETRMFVRNHHDAQLECNFHFIFRNEFECLGSGNRNVVQIKSGHQ